MGHLLGVNLNVIEHIPLHYSLLFFLAAFLEIGTS
jgi:hypothetical protein